MKTYQIKTYNLDGSYKDTINPNDIFNEISFTSNINGGLGELTIDTKYKIDELNYQGGEFVKVVLFDDYHKGGLQIYYGYISQIIRKVEASREYTSFVCLGVNGLLNNILFTNGAQTKTPSGMIEDVLTYFQNSYSCITAGTIDSTETTVQNYNWSYQSCFEIIKSVSEGSGYKFFIDGLGKLNFFKTGSNHFLKLHYDIDELTITNTIEEVVNEYHLERNGGTVKTYSDATSQTTYGKKEKYEKKTDINSANTQDAFGNQFITDNKNSKEHMTIVLNTNYPFENIKPGDTVTILNAGIDIFDKVINKISYKPDQGVLTIDKTDTLWNVIE